MTHPSQIVSTALNPRSARAGFTLVELLVVIAIIGVLAGLALSVAPGIMARQTIARAQAEMQMIAQALEQYKAKYYTYPPMGFIGSDKGLPAENPSDSPYMGDTQGSQVLTSALYGFDDEGIWKIIVPQSDSANTSGGSVSLVKYVKVEATPLLGNELKLGAVNGILLLVDPWGNPYEYYFADRTDVVEKSQSQNRNWKYPGFILYSKGPDGEGSLPASIAKGTATNMAEAVQAHLNSADHYDDLIFGFEIE